MAVNDNFNRANGTLGANWTDTEAGLEIVGNIVRAVSGPTWVTSRYTGASWNATHTSQCSATAIAGNFGGPTVRHQANGDCYVLLTRIFLNTILIGKVISGVFADLQDTGVGSVDGATYKLEVNGTTLKAYKDGVQIGTDQTDSTLSGGAPGLLGRIGSGDCADLDDWEGTGEMSADRFILGSH